MFLNSFISYVGPGKESVQARRDYSPLTCRHSQEHLKKKIERKKQDSFCFVASCELHSAGAPLWTSAEMLL